MAQKSKRPVWAQSSKPPEFIRTVPVVTVRPNDDPRFIILSDSLFGLNCHWTGRQTTPCIGERSECKYCKAEDPKRWRGWLHVVAMRTMRTCILELTVQGGAELLSQLTDGELRGQVIEVKRERPSIHAPLNVQAMGKYQHLDRLPKSVDVWETLCILWKIN